MCARVSVRPGGQSHQKREKKKKKKSGTDRDLHAAGNSRDLEKIKVYEVDLVKVEDEVAGPLHAREVGQGGRDLTKSDHDGEDPNHVQPHRFQHLSHASQLAQEEPTVSVKKR